MQCFCIIVCNTLTRVQTISSFPYLYQCLLLCGSITSIYLLCSFFVSLQFVKNHSDVNIDATHNKIFYYHICSFDLSFLLSRLWSVSSQPRDFGFWITIVKRVLIKALVESISLISGHDYQYYIYDIYFAVSMYTTHLYFIRVFTHLEQKILTYSIKLSSFSLNYSKNSSMQILCCLLGQIHVFIC